MRGKLEKEIREMKNEKLKDKKKINKKFNKELLIILKK